MGGYGITVSSVCSWSQKVKPRLECQAQGILCVKHESTVMRVLVEGSQLLLSIIKLFMRCLLAEGEGQSVAEHRECSRW